jgi:hypothetical protein
VHCTSILSGLLLLLLYIIIITRIYSFKEIGNRNPSMDVNIPTPNEIKTLNDAV